MKKSNKILSVEVIRGMAVFIGVLFHAAFYLRLHFNVLPFNWTFDVGHARVDFFFVLSGFIIHYVYGKNIGQPDKLVDYSMKRFTRIYPVYWIVLLGILAICLLIPSIRHEFMRSPAVIERSFLLWPMVAPDISPVLPPAWTLPYEMFFYAVFALAILNRMLGAVVATIWLMTIIMAHLFGESRYPFYFLASYYNVGFFIGVLMSVLLKRTTGHAYAVPSFIVGAVLFIVNYLFNGVMSLDLTTRGGYAIACGLLIYGVTAYEKNRDISYPKSLMLLGTASYSIYLIHWPVLCALGQLVKHFSIMAYVSPDLTFLGMALFAVLCGLLFHLWIERPLLSLFRKYQGKSSQALAIPPLGKVE